MSQQPKPIRLWSLDPVHHGEADRYGGWSWSEPLTRDGEHFRRCSYCGSINPDDLAEELKTAPWVAEWADRKYGWPHKFYVDIPNRNPARLYVTGTSNANIDGDGPGSGWLNVRELTEDQMKILEENGRDIDRDSINWVLLSTRSAHFGKFYTAHLADPALDSAVKLEIERRSGLGFMFTINDETGDQQVAWAPMIPPSE